MAQPLAKYEEPMPEHPTTGGIDAAASRLETAFRRLEKAVGTVTNSQHSLSADKEKLNRLLRQSEDKIAQLHEVTATVSARLDHTIAVLEALPG